MHTTIVDPAVGRFAWKELRTLRGLWVAVAGLAMLEMAASPFLLMPGANLPPWLLGSALAATVLYTVGAAAIQFSVEHEDETFGFLTILPTTWRPLFAGKLAVVAASALALVILLFAFGWLVAGWPSRSATRWPTATESQYLFGVLGLAIFEALAWGTLFSLLVKRPLVAAILTIVVGAVVAQIAAGSVSASQLGSADPNAYLAAVPARVAIIACVFALATSRARRWLAAGQSRIRPTLGERLSRVFTTPNLLSDRRDHVVAQTHSRRTTLGRLLWQSWRHRWTLPLPAIVALFLWVGVAAMTGLTMGDKAAAMVVAATAMFLPALYGAMVFSADQRRTQYRFLAEHAVPSRSVWYARQMVWAATPVVLIGGVLLIAAAIFGWAFHRHLARFAQAADLHNYAAFEIRYAVEQPLYFFQTASALLGVGAMAALLAYAAGQFCSMLIRSEIMAAFAACVLSVFVTAWAALLVVWQLSGWWFAVLPAAGLLLATWLRAPDWIAERNGWRRWRWPLAAASIPAAAALLLVPPTRLSQIANPELQLADQTIQRQMTQYDAGDTPAARETAAMYFYAIEAFDAISELSDPVAKWREEFPEGVTAMGRFGSVDQLVDADPARIRALWQELLGDRPYDEAMSALLEAQQERDQARRDAFEAALAMFMTATERPTCRFEFDVTNVPAWDMHRRFFVDLENNHIRHELGSQYTNLNQMLFLLLDSDVDAAQSLERYLGLLRAPAHIRSGQPSLVLADQLYVESDILRRIGKWGSGKSRTADELRDAIDKLQAHLATPLHPAESIYADYLLVKIVIDGEQLPIALAAAPYNVMDSLAVNWAYAANRLPWERRRALEALKILAAEQMQIAENTVQCLTSGNSPDTPRNSSQLRARLQDGDYGWDPVFGGRRQPADSSSLARLELRARCNEAALVAALAHAEVYRRATLLQVALVLYRLENDRYPPNLAQLAPDYLDSVPLDPFTGKQFHYLPHGLDEPLRLLHRPRDSRIPARTPFFWSVGAWNADQPSLGETSQTIVDEDDPSREVIERRETVYQLTSRTTEYPDDRYVFPLPK